VPRPRGAIDELGVTAAGDESEAELLAANERFVRVAAQLRELSATQTQTTLRDKQTFHVHTDLSSAST
jgi:hypothetical protein